MKKKLLDIIYNDMPLENGIIKKVPLSLPITMVCNMVHTRGKYIYEKYGLSQAEFDLIATLFISNNGLTATEVSERMIFSAGGISKVVTKLELKKLIYKKTSLEDKRISILFLKENAKKIVKECIPLFEKNDDYFFNILDETEKEILERMFKKILYSISSEE